MKVAILLDNYVEEVEFLYPYYRLKEEGFEVVSLAHREGEYRGKNGMVLRAERSLGKDDHLNFDAVFIPGGYAPDHLRRHREMVDFIRSMNSSGKVIAAVCHGPWLLASAEIISGKRVTSFHSIRDDLVHAGAIYTGNTVEVDGNIITGTDPSALPPMMREMIRILKRNP
ncbi:MAG: type 1 glutamine amidotransferase domain-containing protein [Thermoplasmata archaeon]|jgi:protease I|nr:MAG: protease [Aciduliprofundum sp.]